LEIHFSNEDSELTFSDKMSQGNPYAMSDDEDLA